MYPKSILLILVILLSFEFSALSQTKINYRAPLDIPLVLAANFGELRPNHFHMGVDFKTNGVEGLKLYAIEDGYVSRVKVSPFGYGKVIYVDHPNGITSVFAHCSSFKGKLDSLVKLTQKKEQNFEIEIYFSPIEIPVKKGDVIALSGNTGSSTAPHLHFELRDTETEDALNPLVYGFNISDHKAPEIKALKVYSLSVEGYQIPGKSKTVNISKGKEGFHLPGNTLKVPADYCSEYGGIGFAFDVVDYFDAAPNVCGLYASSIKVNSDTLFEQQIDRVSFDHSRYVNSHKDFAEYTQAKRKFHKSFRSQHNPLCIYPCENLGILSVKPNDSLNIIFKANDIRKNSSQLKFTLKVDPGKMNNTVDIFPSKKYLHPDSSYYFHSEQIEFSIQKHTFYEPTLKNLSLNHVFSLGDPSQPIQYPVSVKMKLPDGKMDKTKFYISVISARGRDHSLDSKLEGEWITAESIYLGSFKVKTDTIPPSLSPLNFSGKETVISKRVLTWKVNEFQTELTDYDLFIDGEWQLLEYESKGDFLFFTRPANLIGSHKLELIVKDSCGNKRIWSGEMIFQ